MNGYLRDRSFYVSRPNNEPKKVHRVSDRAPGMAACDSRRILLDTEREVEVTALNRCRRCFLIPPRGAG